MNRFLSTIVSLFLCLCFVGIIFYVMIGGLHIPDSDNGAAAMVFASIDGIILIGFVGLGKPIAKAIGVGMFAPITTATIGYTILATAATLLLFNVLSSFLFILVKIVLLFILLCVVIPLAVTGKNTRKDENTRPEIKKHNMN